MRCLPDVYIVSILPGPCLYVCTICKSVLRVCPSGAAGRRACVPATAGSDSHPRASLLVIRVMCCSCKDHVAARQKCELTELVKHT
ncbi:hypothetical protein PGIGA_G00226640 [Pangasianodon gigas]|uniref:Uncharacterized protein n=1 Tax=Pangasianodon gigas TaxID=30993 RepID=A0ACC5WKC1_PANGG|nr:hypothetical protein [Pangasianodon gigas]